MNPSSRTKIATLLGLLSFPLAAWSHPGHGTDAGFTAALLHPLTGWDHLLAALAVGLWAARLGGRAAMGLSAAFLGALAAGALAGSATGPLSLAEPGILLSLVVLGALAATGRHMSTAAAAVLAGSFAFWHGTAHGAELAAASSITGLAGLVAGTALVLATGFGFALWRHSDRLPPRVRLAGSAIAAAGLLGILA